MLSIEKIFTTKARRPRIAINWPLWLGILLIGTIAFLAVRGPDLAPKDPLEENLIVKDEVTGEWHIPPFSAFTVTGFPLGSDEFGRDLYSRLLYAIRPTMQMVMIVAGVRLVLGTLIGLVAGYAAGRTGRFFDSLISSALALPGLLVALGAIALVGVELGVLAFVIGLSITGWAETARLVREQTRAVRSEIYVEAAHALGATDAQIVFRHVLRQIRAMLLMLFAFEVGSTLMLTAGLGFLGYYIGGDVWVDVDDFVARRTSGDPELGQMLATAWVRLTDPWGLVAVGSVVFAAVLGFNLIGEGLRLRIHPEGQVRRIRWLSTGWAWLRLNIEQAWDPVGRLLFGSRLAVSLWVLATGFALGYGAVSSWQQGLFTLPEPRTNMFFADDSATPTPPTSGATEAEEGTDHSEASPASPEGDGTQEGETTIKILLASDNGWVYSTPTELLIPPLPHPDGNVYLLTNEHTFYVLNPDGELSAVVPLPEPVFTLENQFFFGSSAADTPFPPILSPDGSIVVASATRLYAIDLDGRIIWEIPLDDVPHSPPISDPDEETYYLLDAQGSLYVFSPAEGLRWKHDLEEGLRPAYFLPVFSRTGEVYYSITNGTRGQIEALDASGKPLWRTPLTTFNFYRPIQITPAGDWISLDDNVVRTSTGELVELAETEFTIDQFAMGQDGKTYLLSGNTVMEWNLSAAGRLNIVRQATVPFPQNVSSGRRPTLIVTGDETIWFRFVGTGGSRLVYQWASFDGTVYNIIDVNLRNTWVLFEDIEEIRLSTCTYDSGEALLTCQGYEKGIPDPVWRIAIEGLPRPNHLQYQNGVLYIQTDNSTLQTVNVVLPPE